MLLNGVFQLLALSDGKPVYGPNFRGACHRLAKAGMVRTFRASSLQLAVELTHDGLEGLVANNESW